MPVIATPKVAALLESAGFAPDGYGVNDETPGYASWGFYFRSNAGEVYAQVETNTDKNLTHIVILDARKGAKGPGKFIPANTDVDLLVIASLLKEVTGK